MSLGIDKDMADIFISYAREDRETTKALAQALEDQGWSVWWDKRIGIGHLFPQEIERELAAARCVIALWSKAASNSQWVWEEARIGSDRNILTPARIEEITLPLGFKTVQTADLIDWGGDQNHPGFAQLIKDITTVLGKASGDGLNLRVFISSSGKRREVARALQDALGSYVEATMCDQDVFRASNSSLESVLDDLSDSDFGIFIVALDDVESCGHQSELSHDNIIFKLGLFNGYFRRHHSFIVVPDSTASQLSVPTNLVGLTYLTYEDGGTNLEAAVGKASGQIMRHIRDVSLKTKDTLPPKVYKRDKFKGIEGTAKEDVWIFRLKYVLDSRSFYDVVAKNLANSVKYTYFVPPDYNFEKDLQALRRRLRRDPRISEDKLDLIFVERLPTAVPLTFVIIDPHSVKSRGFAIIENNAGAATFWVEIPGSQVEHFVARVLPE